MSDEVPFAAIDEQHVADAHVGRFARLEPQARPGKHHGKHAMTPHSHGDRSPRAQTLRDDALDAHLPDQARHVSSTPSRIVIAGLPRSGTTLLATFLASRPHVSFITDYLSCFTEAAAHLGVDDWRMPLERTQRRVALAIVRDQLLRFRHPVLVGVDEFESLRALHEAVLDELVRPGDRAVGHKMLLSAEQVDRLLGQTSLHLVVLYRDPRDAALSYFHRTGGGVEQYLEGWRRMVRLVSTRQHERLFAIRYESLVADPQSTLTPLFDRLGIELRLDLAALVFDRAGAGRIRWSDNATATSPRRPFDARTVERWRDAHASPIVRYAAATCDAELRRVGYSAGPTIAGLERQRWRVHRLVHALADRADESWSRVRALVLTRLAPELRASRSTSSCNRRR